MSNITPIVFAWVVISFMGNLALWMMGLTAINFLTFFGTALAILTMGLVVSSVISDLIDRKVKLLIFGEDHE